jgi:uncharacterized membrane protein
MRVFTIASAHLGDDGALRWLMSWSSPASCGSMRSPTMSLEPLLTEPGVIQVHAFAAMTAFLAALMQLALPKGTPRHRAVGYLWVALMLLVVIPSFWIHTIRQWGPWSWIHLLSIFTLVMLPLGLAHARAHRVTAHRNTMLGLFFGALVVAGVFTLWPGRVMHHVVFGP